MLDILLDILFPRRACCLCRRPGFYWSGSPWCDECQNKMEESRERLNICARCGKFLTDDQPLCKECQEVDPPFFIARAVGPYQGCHRQIIKQYKFMEKRFLSWSMAKMMARLVRDNKDYWPLDIVVPVPMSREGLLRRGFNQSELLASCIARDLKVKYDPDVLLRVKDSSPQRELSKEMREKNLLDAFVVSKPERVKGKNILLVDDVYTTGSTAKECTRTLLKAGANRVGVISWSSGKGF